MNSKNKIIESINLALSANKKIKIHAKGVSMYPFLKKDDQLIITKIAFNNIKKGDIIAFKLNNEIVAHRVINKNNSNSSQQILTKGDSCINNDGFIQFSNILGKVISYKRKNKTQQITNLKFVILGKVFVILTPVMPLIYKVAKLTYRLIHKVK